MIMNTEKSIDELNSFHLAEFLKVKSSRSNKQFSACYHKHMGTLGIWTMADQREAGMLDALFYQLSYDVNHFWKFRKLFLGRVETLTITNYEHFSMGGVETLTIVPGRSRSERTVRFQLLELSTLNQSKL